MKTIVKVFSAIVLTILFSLPFVAQASEFTVLAEGNQEISLVINKAFEGAVHLVLKDAEGTVRHQESALYASVKNRSIDLQLIPSGEYTLVVEYANIIGLQPISKVDDKLVVNSAALKTTFTPSVKQIGELLDLNMLFLGDFDVELSITSATGDVIYKNAKNHSGAFHKRLGLHGLEDGDYIFTIKIKSDEITKEFSKEISRFGLASNN